MGDSVKTKVARKTGGTVSLQPKCFLYPSGRSLLLRPSAGPGYLVTYQSGQQHPEIKNCQRRINLLMDGSSLFPKWRDPSGAPWKPLLDNGMFDQPTEDALGYFQSLWGFDPTGKLCATTRMLLQPSLRLSGTLWYQPSPQSKINLFPKLGMSKSQSTPGWLQSPPASPAKPANADDDNDDKPWVPKLSFSNGLAFNQSLWIGQTISGGKAPRSAWLPELYQKFEFDVELATGVALLKSPLKLAFGFEGDRALDRAHSPAGTIQGNVQLGLDDLVKRDWFGLSANLQTSIQQQGKQVSGAVQAGVELEVKPWRDDPQWKNFSVTLDGNIGYQHNFSGLEKHDSTSVIPLGGSVNLKGTF